MDGLIKGLVDVALNRGGRDDDSRDDRDERSRSSWAEVVSGDQEEPNASDHHTQHQERYEQKQERYERKEQWQSGGSKPATTTQEYGDTHDDGWETVGRKQPKKHHKVPTNQWNDYKRPPSASKNIQVRLIMAPT